MGLEDACGIGEEAVLETHVRGRIEFGDIKQVLANFGLWAKSDPVRVPINSFIRMHFKNCVVFLMAVFVLQLQLNSCCRDHIAHKS